MSCSPIGLAVDRLGAEAASRIFRVAAIGGRGFARFDSGSPCRVRQATAAPRAKSRDLPSIPRRQARPFRVALARSSETPPSKSALTSRMRCGLPSNAVDRMQERVVIELDERLERDPEPAAVIQNCVMMIGNAPRSRIDVEAGIELAGLGRPAEFGIDVAAPERPVASAGTEVEFEDADADTPRARVRSPPSFRRGLRPK